VGCFDWIMAKHKRYDKVLRDIVKTRGSNHRKIFNGAEPLANV